MRSSATTCPVRTAGRASPPPPPCSSSSAPCSAPASPSTASASGPPGTCPCRSGCPRSTWALLCQLTGRPAFLCAAVCKLATADNMAYLHQRGGRFLSVLPRTRGEDATFRTTVRDGRVRWRHVHDKRDDEGEVVDRF